MARVNINAFTDAVNNYSTIVRALDSEIGKLNEAASTLKSGISGDEAGTQALYSDLSKRQEDVATAISSIKSVIAKIQTTHESYIRKLGILS